MIFRHSVENADKWLERLAFTLFFRHLPILRIPNDELGNRGMLFPSG